MFYWNSGRHIAGGEVRLSLDDDSSVSSFGTKPAIFIVQRKWFGLISRWLSSMSPMSSGPPPSFTMSDWIVPTDRSTRGNWTGKDLATQCLGNFYCRPTRWCAGIHCEIRKAYSCFFVFFINCPVHEEHKSSCWFRLTLRNCSAFSASGRIRGFSVPCSINPWKNKLGPDVIRRLRVSRNPSMVSIENLLGEVNFTCVLESFGSTTLPNVSWDRRYGGTEEVSDEDTDVRG